MLPKGIQGGVSGMHTVTKSELAPYLPQQAQTESADLHLLLPVQCTARTASRVALCLSGPM